MEAIQYSPLYGIKAGARKIEPINVYRQYKRQRSDESTSNSSWGSASPIQSPIINPMALATYQPYQTPIAQKMLPYNNFMTSTPSMSTLAAAAASVPACNLTMAFLQALQVPLPYAGLPMYFAPPPNVDHQMYCARPPPSPQMTPSPPLQMGPSSQMTPSPPPQMPPPPQMTSWSPPSTKIRSAVVVTPERKEKEEEVGESSVLVSARSIVPELKYQDTRFTELVHAEQTNLMQFIHLHIDYFELSRSYRQQKARSVCRKKETENENLSAEALAEKERKAEYRQLNNENSQRSRQKQRVQRLNEALTAIFLRDRVASYERRIQTLIDIIMKQKGAK